MNTNHEAILDLIKACNLIIKFCANLDEISFLDDEKTQSSVLYQIVIIGEAVNRLTPDFIGNYPQIPFKAALSALWGKLYLKLHFFSSSLFPLP